MLTRLNSRNKASHPAEERGVAHAAVRRPGFILRPPGRALAGKAEDQWGCSSVGEFVAHAVDRQKVARFRRVRLDLMADVFDMCVNGTFIRLEMPRHARHPAAGQRVNTRPG